MTSRSVLAAFALLACSSSNDREATPANTVNGADASDASPSVSSNPDASAGGISSASGGRGPATGGAGNSGTGGAGNAGGRADASQDLPEASTDSSPSDTGAPGPRAPIGDIAPPSGLVWQAIPELSDEFDGAALDGTKWMPSHPYWQGRPPSQFDPANVSVAGGELQLISTTTVDSLSNVANPDQDIWVKAACVSSKASVASYGFYEARMKASELSMTSSFWFQGTYSEIDVVEELGRPIINPGDQLLMQMNTHYFAGGWANDVATPEQWPMPTGAADAYHVYGVWWRDESSVWFFHDGVKVAEMVPGGAFAETMYLFFDTEVFTWYGLPTVASLKDPALRTMHVDWVHAFRAVPQ